MMRWLKGSSAATGRRIGFAFAGALITLNLISFMFGQAPLDTLVGAITGTWGTAYGIGQVLFKATPLLLTGLAFHVALRSGLFNIGAEGQLALASLVAAWVATKLPASLAWPLVLIIVLAAAVLVGGAYSAIAGAMRARLGVHEIISGIMLNRSADVFLPWALVVGIGATGLRTADIAPGARLPGLDRWFDAFRGSAVSVAFPLVVIVTFGIYRWLDRSRAGREMRWVGLGAQACAAQGINVARRRIQAMFLSGVLDRELYDFDESEILSEENVRKICGFYSMITRLMYALYPGEVYEAYIAQSVLPQGVPGHIGSGAPMEAAWWCWLRREIA